jgi:hypothetical protein
VGREKFARDLLARFYARDKLRCAKNGVGTDNSEASRACHDRKKFKRIAMLQRELF